MTDAECVFCGIAAGAVPASLVYEDDAVMAFLDLYPVHAGHTLVIPRYHAADLLACPDQLASRVFAVAARIAPAVVQVTGAQGFNIWIANGPAAGQTVFHLHLHVLPRFREDSFGLRFPGHYPTEADRGELETMARRIRAKV